MLFLPKRSFEIAKICSAVVFLYVLHRLYLLYHFCDTCQMKHKYGLWLFQFLYRVFYMELHEIFWWEKKYLCLHNCRDHPFAFSRFHIWDTLYLYNVCILLFVIFLKKCVTKLLSAVLNKKNAFCTTKVLFSFRMGKWYFLFI